MRRADRLFRIVEYLKARREAVTAEELAAEMETGVRTIYRDVVDLRASGVPLIGEAGVGYLLDRDYLVKPLMFDVEELESLTLGAQMVESWATPLLRVRPVRLLINYRRPAGFTRQRGTPFLRLLISQQRQTTSPHRFQFPASSYPCKASR